MNRALPFVLAVSLVIASRAAADDDARARAKMHFDRAMQHLSQNQLRDAQRELASAHRLHPHFAVLYNIGKLHVDLDEPLAAVRELERYLREGGDRIDATRRAEVERIIGEQMTKLGRVSLVIEPAGAAIAVDGKPAGTIPLERPLVLEPGRHELVVSLPGYESETRELQAIAGKEQVVTLRLTKLSPALALVKLRVRCPVPDATISIDGRPHARTPADAILAPAGMREITFERAGYAPSRRRVVVERDGSSEIACDLRARSPLPREHAGRVEIAVDEPYTLLVDGQRVSAGAPLPHGRHRLEVRALGFRPWAKSVVVEREKTLRLAPDLEPNDDTLRERQSQRTLAYALGAHGVGLLAAAGVLYVYNTTRHQEWEDEQKDLDADWDDPNLGDARALDKLRADQIRNDEQLESIRRFDRLTVGIAAVGGALVIAGVVVYVTGDDPAPRSQPTVAIGPNGSSLGWRHVW